MASAYIDIRNFRNKINQVLSALEDAQGAAQTIDYLGGAGFYRSELERVNDVGESIHDITTAQMTAAINSLGAIKTLLEADNQSHGKALARMRD